MLNSATVLARIIPMQPRGWRDPRDFDNLVWELPVPEYDRRVALHRDLAEAATQAEHVASMAPLGEGAHSCVSGGRFGTRLPPTVSQPRSTHSSPDYSTDNCSAGRRRGDPPDSRKRQLRIFMLLLERPGRDNRRVDH